MKKKVSRKITVHGKSLVINCGKYISEFCQPKVCGAEGEGGRHSGSGALASLSLQMLELKINVYSPYFMPRKIVAKNLLRRNV